MSRPQDTFSDNSFYLAVRNPDFALQGPLRYDLTLRYIPAMYMQKGSMLYKFWELTRAAWPGPPAKYVEVVGDPPEELRYYDLDHLLNDLRRALPQLIQELGIEDRIERTLAEADFEYILGAISETAGLHADAQRFYLQSSSKSRECGNTDKEAKALIGLKDVYIKLGKMNEANQIAERLEALGVRAP